MNAVQNDTTKTTEENFDNINEILSEFDNLQPDPQTSSLCSTSEIDCLFAMVNFEKISKVQPF